MSTGSPLRRIIIKTIMLTRNSTGMACNKPPKDVCCHRVYPHQQAGGRSRVGLGACLRPPKVFIGSPFRTGTRDEARLSPRSQHQSVKRRLHHEQHAVRRRRPFHVLAHCHLVRHLEQLDGWAELGNLVRELVQDLAALRAGSMAVLAASASLSISSLREAAAQRGSACRTRCRS